LPLIGIGPALRKAREQRGRSIDEASRDTKIRVDYLHALERESFEALGGDVYARGFLRSYSQYLGLDQDKVLAAFAKSMGESEPTEVPEPLFQPDRPSSPLHPADRTRSWLIAGAVVFVLVVVAAALGMLSRSHTTPPSVGLPAWPPSVHATEPRVKVGLIAQHEIDAVVSVDGDQVFSGLLAAQEARNFVAVDEISVSFPRGGVVRLIVNGEDRGELGTSEQPYSATFYPSSPTPSPGEGGLP